MTSHSHSGAVLQLAAEMAARASRGQVLVVGVTGSVAAGKSTLCAALKTRLEATHRVATVSTDGFLLPTALLNERGIGMRKGYPESYDIDALLGAIDNARIGPTTFPGYSHVTYDADPALARLVESPDILIVEGLALSPLPDGRRPADHLDLLIYLDADEADIEAWFVDRFMQFWRAAESDPASFYAQFRSMSEAEAEAFARVVWAKINLPNLREHIVLARDDAHIVLRKARNHELDVTAWLAPARP